MKKSAPTKGDWREEILDRIRALILEADPEMREERKWKKPSNGMAGIPVWSHDGINEKALHGNARPGRLALAFTASARYS